MIGFPSIVLAESSQEVAFFRISGFDGYLSGRFLFEEETETQGSEGNNSHQRHPVFEEELHLRLHSYVYHPNFLKITVGGGPVLTQETLEADSQRTFSSDTFYNASVNLTFLEKKPYPLILFYDHLYPRIPLGGTERFLLTDTKYGFKFQQPFGPIPFYLEGYRQTQTGEGGNQITDEFSDHLTLEAEQISIWQGDASLLYQFNRRDSASGTLRIPIKKTRTTTHSVNFNTEQIFGARDQVRFRNMFSLFKRLESPERRDIHINPTMQWDLTDSLIWSARYDLGMSRIAKLDITNQAASTDLRHQFYESLFSKLDIHTSNSRSSGVNTQTYGGSGELLYRKKIPFGAFTLQYNGTYDIRDHRSTASEVPIFGEIHVLSELFPAELRYDNIKASTVVVFNAARNRIFTEGIDYRLITVGDKTSIQRLPTGDIENGETVLVDYHIVTEGIYKFSIFTQHYEANVSLFSFLTLRARFRKAPQRLLSGSSTQPLKSTRSQLYSAKVHIPIGDMVIDGGSEYEDHREEGSPFRRTSYTLSLNAPLFSSTRITLTGRRMLVDYPKSVEDVDLKGANIRLESTPWSRIYVTAEAVYEKDIGGTLTQQNWFGTLRAEWRVRQLTLRAEASFKQEQRSKSEREIIRTKVELRRAF